MTGDISTGSLGWMWTTRLAVMATILACAAHAQVAVSIVNCGTENRPVCTSNDPEYYANNVDGGGQPCDYGLQPSGETCVNANRHTFADYRTDPVGKALHDQLYSVQADQPLNHDVFLGSHNSFSSYREDIRGNGGVGIVPDALPGYALNITPQILADQELSITDQLASGARFIVLHPHYYQNQLRVCHDNFSDALEREICDAATHGRLFAYAVQEIAAWLDQNPGEFVILRLLHDVGKYGEASQLAVILNYYFGSKIYQTDANVSPSLGTFPSLRQLRSQGKQIMIIGGETEGSDDPTHSLDQVMWDWNTYVLNDGYTDATGWSTCQNTDGSSVIYRPSGQFAYTAEDRSGSNALTAMQLEFQQIGNTITTWWNDFTGLFTGQSGGGSSYNGGGAGLLNPGDIPTALDCTYGIIGLDFWAAGPSAYYGVPIPGVSAIPGISFDFRFPNPDQRQAQALWTFPAQRAPILASPAPVSSDGITGWHPDDPSNGYQFLCANITQSIPNRQALSGWTLRLSGTAGGWSGGELNCQGLGSGWHFWAPETPFEQETANAVIAIHSPGQPVWLNMKIAGPGQRPPLVVTPASANIYWTRGTTYPSLPYLFTKGGTGGTLSVAVTAGAGDTVFTQASNNGSSIMAGFNPTAVQNLPAGDHYNNIVITENDPVYGPMTYTFPIMLEVDENLVVQPATTTSLDNCATTSQTLYLTSGGPFTLASDQPWLSASASAYNTQVPATLTLSYVPANLAPGNYTGHIIVTGPYAKNNSVTITVNLHFAPQTSLVSSPGGIQISVDGTAVTTPASYCWAPGQKHTLVAPELVPKSNGSGYMFSQWQSPAASANNQITVTAASAASTTISAEFKTAFQVTAVSNPPGGGSVSGAAWYQSGQRAVLGAVPAKGFAFGSFTGNGESNANPYTFQVNQATAVTANFTQSGAILFANTAGPRTDAAPGVRNVPLQIMNTSAGGFGDVQLTGIDGFQTIAGTGAVQLQSSGRIALGNLAPGGSASFTAQMSWPASATRVRFTVHFIANGGAYSGSTTLTLNR